VKLLKLLTVPAVLVVSAMMAVPVFANHATVSKLTATCDNTQKICFHIEFTPSDIPNGGSRTITVELFGEAKGSTTFTDTKVGHQITIDSTENGKLQTVDFCFDKSAIDVSKFAQFEVQVIPGDNIDLGTGGVNVSQVFECPASTPTPPTPTASGSGGGSPTPTANTAVPLAQTGGFDFRYPLIGLILLVAGGALFVVSASRGRSSAPK